MEEALTPQQKSQAAQEFSAQVEQEARDGFTRMVQARGSWSGDPLYDFPAAINAVRDRWQEPSIDEPLIDIPATDSPITDVPTTDSPATGAPTTE